MQELDRGFTHLATGETPGPTSCGGPDDAVAADQL